MLLSIDGDSKELVVFVGVMAVVLLDNGGELIVFVFVGVGELRHAVEEGFMLGVG